MNDTERKAIAKIDAVCSNVLANLELSKINSHDHVFTPEESELLLAAKRLLFAHADWYAVGAEVTV